MTQMRYAELLKLGHSFMFGQARMMTHDNLLSDDLLESLYSAATKRGEWSTFCDRLSWSLNAPVLLFGHASNSNQSLGLTGGNIDPAHLQSYKDHYGSINPWMSMNLLFKPGVVGVSDGALSRRELVKTEFYNDWLRHQDNAIAGPAMICHRSPHQFVSIAASANARTVDAHLPEMVEIMRALSPHMMHCVDISATLANGHGTTSSHLNASRHAIVLIHRSGRTGFINESAINLFEISTQIYMQPNGGLASTDPAVAHHLTQAIAAISGGSIRDLPPPTYFEFGRMGQCTIHAHIFPENGLHAFPENVWADPVSGAIVIAGYGGLTDDADAETIARSCGATPAEAKLAGAVVGGQSLYEFAERNSLSRHTVRNQMRALLLKMESRDQVDFVRKINLCMSPFKSVVSSDR